MTYPNITTTDVEAKVRELAAADPDHVYVKGDGGCVNIASDGSEACLIGRALMDLGVSEALFIEHGIIGNGAEVTLDTLGITGGADWLGEVQGSQDQGEPWKLAIERADGDYPRIPA